MADAIINSVRFYDMHNLEVEYETRPQSKILPLEKVRPGLAMYGYRALLFYSRPPPTLQDPELKSGEIKTPIKFLARLNSQNQDVNSPVFFYAYGNFESKLAEYQNEINSEYASFQYEEDFKVNLITEVPIGGVFVVRSVFDDEFVRIRVTKVNLTTQEITYWAIDEAFYDTCKPTEMWHLSEDLANMEMLAVPGYFQQAPTPKQLERFEGKEKSFIMAKLMQPIYGFDHCPRKITLVQKC